eukprot:GFYU01002877.1.p1 GENE.GFYU01002877.1~~GFYU01002877.1.p1  ORF type:complete len:417 (-),score=165.15 GFYU01002877.1:139-1344(-)
MALKLYTYPENPRAFKALIAAQYNGIEITLPKFEMGKTNKTAEFLKKNPLGKIPVLDTPKGSLFESNAIARYVARLRADTELYGRNFFESGQVDQWIDFAVNEIDMPVAAWFYPIAGYIPANQAATDKAKKDLGATLKTLNDYLLKNTYLVGNKVTLADIIVCCALLRLFTHCAGPDYRKPFGNVMRWFNTCVNQPEFKKALGTVTLCAGGKGSASPKVAAKSPKAAAKSPKAAPAEEPKPAKAKNPLDDLPPPKMVLDTWKRKYSNSETREEALPYFWENFDAKDYSLWFCDYLYNDELTKAFMSSNLIGGWFQRLDRLRKYGFGCVSVYGVDGDHFISGAWLFRGQEVPEPMTTCDDSELYKWRKIDPKNKADKKLLEDYWSWDVPLRGKEHNDGKVFK